MIDLVLLKIKKPLFIML